MSKNGTDWSEGRNLLTLRHSRVNRNLLYIKPAGGPSGPLLARADWYRLATFRNIDVFSWIIFLWRFFFYLQNTECVWVMCSVWEKYRASASSPRPPTVLFCSPIILNCRSGWKVQVTNGHEFKFASLCNDFVWNELH